jgi:hypothetical protein
MVQPVRSLGELARHGGSLRVECRRCRRIALFGVAETADYFRRKGWVDDWDSLPGRFRCGCGARQAAIAWCEGTPPPGEPRAPEPRHVYPPPGIDPLDWATANARERRRLLRVVRS